MEHILSPSFNEEFINIRADQYRDLIKEIIKENIQCPNAWLAIGFAYVVGKFGLVKNMSTAKEFYQKAYYCGHPFAAFRLGMMIVDADGDRIKALEYYIHAAKYGVAAAWGCIPPLIEKILQAGMITELLECYRSSFADISKFPQYRKIFGNGQIDQIWQELEMNYRNRLEIL